MKASDWENVEGSSKTPKCPNCGVWINHWKNYCKLDSIEMTKALQKCSVYGCNGVGDNGAHIQNPDANEIYIVPMCGSCNPHNGKFTLKDKTIVVIADPKKSCGAKGTSTLPLREQINATQNDYDKAKEGVKDQNGGWFY
jgi:RNA polymerase subunit RPABC4/transcription elongation factor Spt4